MDTQDFDVNVTETLELVNRSIELMALDQVECYPDGHELRMEFRDMSFFLLTADPREQKLVLHTPAGQHRLHWDNGEEQWIEDGGVLDLFRLLSREMGRHLGEAFQLEEAE
jgi:frataxin-like iron-binding protein CyaY